MTRYFIKYRHMWSHGDDEWEHKEICSNLEEDIEEELYNLKEEWNYSEHYRGIDWELELPPKKWFEEKIQEYTNRQKWIKNQIRDYKKIVENL